MAKKESSRSRFGWEEGDVVIHRKSTKHKSTKSKKKRKVVVVPKNLTKKK